VPRDKRSDIRRAQIRICGAICERNEKIRSFSPRMANEERSLRRDHALINLIADRTMSRIRLPTPLQWLERADG